MQEAFSQSERNHNRFFLATDDFGKSWSVPSPGTLQGSAVYDTTEKNYHILYEPVRTTDEEDDTLIAIWKNIQAGNGRAIFPRILDAGNDGVGAFHIAALPDGMPLLDYMLASQPWSGKTVARVLAEFVWELDHQTALPIDKFAISYESIWIEQTIYGPRLFLGSLGGKLQNQAKADNMATLLSVFQDLVKDEGEDHRINRLIREMRKEEIDFKKIEERLSQFAMVGDSRNISWEPQNEPGSYFKNYSFPKVDVPDEEIEAETETKQTEEPSFLFRANVTSSQIKERPPKFPIRHRLQYFWSPNRKMAASALFLIATTFCFAACIVWAYYQMSWEAKSQLHYQLESSELYHVLNDQLKKCLSIF